MGGRLDEDGLIARYFAPLAQDPGAWGLKDDAATVSVGPDEDLVVTTDAIVAGVHFFETDLPDHIARKALRVNLSDLAAKGATPAGALLTLALPDGWTEDFLKGFAHGLSTDLATYACPLLGGDTVRTPGPLLVSVTAFGRVLKGGTVRRTGARPGDVVLVTGTIGDAAIGCRLLLDRGLLPELEADDRDVLLERYWLPQPRTRLAEAVRRHASASMDVSDGLVGDLAKLCRVSSVGAVFDIEAVPLSPAVRAAVARHPDALRWALTGGDDYEIAMTAPPAAVAELIVAGSAAGVPVTPIGRVTAAPQVAWLNDGRPVDFGPGSYSHF